MYSVFEKFSFRFLKNFLFVFLSKSAAQGADQVYFWYNSAL